MPSDTDTDMAKSEHSEYIPWSVETSDLAVNTFCLQTTENEIISDSEMSDVLPIQYTYNQLEKESEPTHNNQQNEDPLLDEDFKVDNAKVNDLGNRVWDKRHCCVFCYNIFAKLPCHFEQKHSDELEVIEALSLPLKSTERRMKWRELMNKGDFRWNRKAVMESKGTIIPFKRSGTKDKYKASDYLSCENCFAFFLKHELWRHAQKCPGKKLLSKWQVSGIKQLEHLCLYQMSPKMRSMKETF